MQPLKAASVAPSIPGNHTLLLMFAFNLMMHHFDHMLQNCILASFKLNLFEGYGIWDVRTNNEVYYIFGHFLLLVCFDALLSRISGNIFGRVVKTTSIHGRVSQYS